MYDQEGADFRVQKLFEDSIVNELNGGCEFSSFTLAALDLASQANVEHQGAYTTAKKYGWHVDDPVNIAVINIASRILEGYES